MACFIAPTTAAILTQKLRKKIPPRFHIDWLLTMLWGGVVWLIPEHIYHGEVVLYPPFFTAGLSKIVPEVLTVGISMVAATIAIWTIMVLISQLFVNKTFRLNQMGLLMLGAVLMIFIDRIVF